MTSDPRRPRRRRPPRPWRAATGLLAGGALLLVAGCGSSHAASPAAGSSGEALGAAQNGTLSVSGAYVPQPPAGTVAAAYFTVTNRSATAVLVSEVTTPEANSTMLMHYVTGPGGLDAMEELNLLTVPAHGSVTLHPGADHLMLMNPVSLHLGQHVLLTLRTTTGLVLRVSAPVVPATGPSETPSAMSGMTGMAGMGN